MLKNKPGQRLAYLPYADVELLAECLVALANGDGGLIVLGVDDEGRPSGNIWEEEAEGALREAVLMCRPPVPTQWQPVEQGAERLVGIYVPRSTELHSLHDGRVLVRSEIGAMDREGSPTLDRRFAVRPQPAGLFPQSGVVFVKFPGTEPRGEDGGIGLRPPRRN
jgi:predicted HTH transcriptional regulator